MTDTVLTEEKRIKIVAERIFRYYLDIIKYKKSKGVKSFVIDYIPSRLEGQDMGKVTLEDKYDGKSTWREYLGMLAEEADWFTIHGDKTLKEFYEIGRREDGMFSIDMKKVLPEVSKFLSKDGVANYFCKPGEHEASEYFCNSDDSWLVVVL